MDFCSERLASFFSLSWYPLLVSINLFYHPRDAFAARIFPKHLVIWNIRML